MSRSLFSLWIRNLPLPVPSPTLGAILRVMNNNNHHRRTADSRVKSNPRLLKLRRLVTTNVSGGWEEAWKEGVTPWDLGRPTLLFYIFITPDPSPWAGFSFLDVALAMMWWQWHALDAMLLVWTYPRRRLRKQNRFFCAIEPAMRSAWAQQIQNFLKPDGELITLMFPMDDHAGGPPYKVSITNYEDVLHPLGFKAISIVDNKLAIEVRKGREKLGRWKRALGHSSL